MGAIAASDGLRLEPDGTRRQDQRAQFLTDDGTLILMHYEAAVIRGDALHPGPRERPRDRFRRPWPAGGTEADRVPALPGRLSLGLARALSATQPVIYDGGVGVAQDDSCWEAFVGAVLAVRHASERRSRYGDKPALFIGNREIAHLEAPGVIDLRITRDRLGGLLSIAAAANA